MCCATHVTPEIKSTIIGSPFPPITFTVLSNDIGYPIPRLGIGELHIGEGYHYHDDHELPRSRTAYSNARKVLRNSGDVVRMLGNGHFEYIGRTASLDKMRGPNIDLDEISYVLKTGHPGITNVTTLVIECSESSKDHLVSFLVVPKPRSCEEYPSKSDYRAIRNAARFAARGKLPAYMVPSISLTLSNIPLSPAGKIDKRALVSLFRQRDPREWPDENGDSDELQSQPDLSKDENELFDIFSRFSGVNKRKIGRDTTIYRLGLDSISAVQIASELRSRGSTVSAADILEVKNALNT
jgi:acyl-coenzyme A synthetase/AMP-(fatty) acid ligase